MKLVRFGTEMVQATLNGDMTVFTDITGTEFELGDYITVLEPWRAGKGYDGVGTICMPRHASVHYEADGKPDKRFGELREAGTMLPEFSRLTLVVTEVAKDKQGYHWVCFEIHHVGRLT